MTDLRAATAAKDKVKKRLKGMPGIGAIGVGWAEDGSACVRVNVSPEFGDFAAIPAALDGVRIVVFKAGDAEFLSAPEAPAKPKRR
jgi:hypothetical protein